MLKKLAVTISAGATALASSIGLCPSADAGPACPYDMSSYAGQDAYGRQILDYIQRDTAAAQIALTDLTHACIDGYQTPAAADSAPDPVSQPAASSSKVDAAVAKAYGGVGTDAFGPTGCLRFVANAYGAGPTGYPSALDLRNALNSDGQIHMDPNPPAGALVFSQSQWDVIDGKHYGHVVIARGDGTFISGGVDSGYRGLEGGGHNVQLLSSWNPAGGADYLGWAYAPW